MKKLSWKDVVAMFDMPNSARVVSINVGKHDASKRGYKHKHGLSKGQRKDAAKRK